MTLSVRRAQPVQGRCYADKHLSHAGSLPRPIPARVSGSGSEAESITTERLYLWLRFGHIGVNVAAQSVTEPPGNPLGSKSSERHKGWDREFRDLRQSETDCHRERLAEGTRRTTRRSRPEAPLDNFGSSSLQPIPSHYAPCRIDRTHSVRSSPQFSDLHILNGCVVGPIHVSRHFEGIRFKTVRFPMNLLWCCPLCLLAISDAVGNIHSPRHVVHRIDNDNHIVEPKS